MQLINWGGTRSRLSKGILKQLNLFHVDANRYVLNVALESGFVKTVVVEFETEIPQDRLELACRIISAKFAGKAREEITIDDEKVIGDVPDLELGIIRLLVPSIRKLLWKDETEEVFADG